MSGVRSSDGGLSSSSVWTRNDKRVDTCIIERRKWVKEMGNAQRVRWRRCKSRTARRLASAMLLSPLSGLCRCSDGVNSVEKSSRMREQSSSAGDSTRIVSTSSAEAIGMSLNPKERSQDRRRGARAIGSWATRKFFNVGETGWPPNKVTALTCYPWPQRTTMSLFSSIVAEVVSRIAGRLVMKSTLTVEDFAWTIRSPICAKRPLGSPWRCVDSI